MNDVREVIRQLQERSSTQALSSQDILDLFSNLFGQDQWRERGLIKSFPKSLTNDEETKPGMSESSGQSSSDPDEVIIDTDGSKHPRKTRKFSTPSAPPLVTENRDGAPNTFTTNSMELSDDPTAMVTSKYPHDQMENVLELLRKVNFILEQLSMFWSNTEIVLDLLSKKGQHAEQFVGFSRNPKLLARFKDRLGEYRFEFLLFF